MNNKWVVIALLAALPLFLKPGFAQDHETGKTLLAQGNVRAAMKSGEERTLKRRSALYEKDEVRVGKNSKAQLRMIDGALISLHPETVFFIDEYVYLPNEKGNRAVLKLISGGLRTLTGSIGKTDHNEYSLSTPLQTIGIRGTDYEILILLHGVWIAVWGGAIDVTSLVCPGFGGIRLGDGEAYRFVFIGNDCRKEFFDSPPQNLEDLGEPGSPTDPTDPYVKDQPLLENNTLQQPEIKPEFDDYDFSDF